MAQQAPSHPFTVLVVDEAPHAGGFAFDEAARLVSRIPTAELHALYILPRRTSLAAMEEIAPSLRGDTSGRAAQLGVGDRLMAIHVRADDATSEILELAREVSADVVVLPERERISLHRWVGRSGIETLRAELRCPLVAVGRSPEAPSIEPPCAACIATRSETRGHTWWCPMHAQPHHLAHRYGYRREHPLAEHDAEVIPTGIRFD